MEPEPKPNFALPANTPDLSSGVFPVLNGEGPGLIYPSLVGGPGDLLGGIDGTIGIGGEGEGDGDGDSTDELCAGQSWTVMEIF